MSNISSSISTSDGFKNSQHWSRSTTPRRSQRDSDFRSTNCNKQLFLITTSSRKRGSKRNVHNTNNNTPKKIHSAFPLLPHMTDKGRKQNEKERKNRFNPSKPKSLRSQGLLRRVTEGYNYDTKKNNIVTKKEMEIFHITLGVDFNISRKKFGDEFPNTKIQQQLVESLRVLAAYLHLFQKK